MTYKIGTRVRVVRIRNAENRYLLGREGRINAHVCFFGIDLYGLDILPLWEGVGAGFLCDQLEPITGPKHETGIKGTCELLDKLLSEVSRETV